MAICARRHVEDLGQSWGQEMRFCNFYGSLVPGVVPSSRTLPGGGHPSWREAPLWRASIVGTSRSHGTRVCTMNEISLSASVRLGEAWMGSSFDRRFDQFHICVSYLAQGYSWTSFVCAGSGVFFCGAAIWRPSLYISLKLYLRSFSQSRTTDTPRKPLRTSTMTKTS